MSVIVCFKRTTSSWLACGCADRLHLIHAHDLDLNDSDTYSEVVSDNSTLQNAVSHDIASKGTYVADSAKQHQVGAKKVWKNKVTIKGKEFQSGKQKMVELRAAPNAPIKYTTNGAHPSQGASYDSAFPVPPRTVIVLAEAEKAGVVSERYELRINWDQTGGVVVDPTKPAVWKRPVDVKSTKESFEFTARLDKRRAKAGGVRITVSGARWAEMSFDPSLRLDKKQLEGAVEHLRSLLQEGEVRVEANDIAFEHGQELLGWVAEVKTELKPGEMEQLSDGPKT